MNVALTHPALHVVDLVAWVEFYASYCGMRVIHERTGKGSRIVWMAERGREQELIFVLLPGGPQRHRSDADYGHLGFALPSRDEVDAMASRARREGRLLWEPRDEPYPVGYYCGVLDPDGNAVEFSYGQPLGPGGMEDPQ